MITKLEEFINENKYDTTDKKINFLKKKGSIITFKNPFKWKGDKFTQIEVTGFEKSKNGNVKILGFGRNTEWFDNIDSLINSVDWNKMEEFHS